MKKPRIIYCAGGNKRFADIAIRNGFFYGARIPRDKPHYPIYFADQDWRKPRKEDYIRLLSIYRPMIATVLDLEKRSQVRTVIKWAEEASKYTKYIVIIPKVKGVISEIPRIINKKEVILGYSVPTKYGSTPIKIQEFSGWKVHLLGGSPHRQMNLWKIMKEFCDIYSVDGNYIQLIALRYNKFWTNGNAHYAENRWLPRLDEADGKKWNIDAPYEAFRRSCINVINAWNDIVS
jgi:hypothetical protein